MPLVVVDLCGTIVFENTTLAFLRHLNRVAPSLRRTALLSRAGFAAANMLQSFPHRKLLAASLGGFNRSELLTQANVYAGDALRRAARTAVVARVARSTPDIVLASASFDFIVEAFANQLGVNRWIATELHYNLAGVCLGSIRRDATGRKRERLEELLGAPLHGHEVFTDNREDVDLQAGSAHFEMLDARGA